ELEPEQHVTLVDVRRVASGNPAAFGLLQAYSRRQLPLLGRVVMRMAIVRPEGLLGAAASGFFGIEEAPCPVEVFDDRRRALEWLRVDPSFDDELEAYVQSASGTVPFLRDLRILLDAKPKLSSADEVARALAVSTRTLQRRLRDERTTLSREIGEARVR